MKTEFLKVRLPADLQRLVTFDHHAFAKSDWFASGDWKEYTSYWMLVNNRRVGCCAFQPQGDSLYIASTAILPEKQGIGFGQLLKAWQIAYARSNGFKRIVIHTRKSNRAMIAVNRKFGFRVVRTVAGYYADPVEPGVVMELRLKP